MADDIGLNDEVEASSVNLGSQAGLPPPEILELDHVYEALAHPRRRYLCYSLLQEPEGTLTDLANEVAAWESDCPESDVDDQKQTRVYISLYHSHVPTLVDQNVVSFDDETEAVSPAENGEQVLAALAGMGARLEDSLEAHPRGERTDTEQ